MLLTPSPAASAALFGPLFLTDTLQKEESNLASALASGTEQQPVPSHLGRSACLGLSQTTQSISNPEPELQPAFINDAVGLSWA